jgi:hypothetical protein
MRKADADAPHDPAKSRALAVAEAFDNGSDPSNLPAELAHARALSPSDPTLAYIDAWVADSHGKPAEALEGYLRTIELAAKSARPEAQSLIEAVSYSVLGQSGMTRGYSDKVRARLMPILQGATLSAAARGALGDVLVPLSWKRGDFEAVKKVTAALGCAQSYAVAGPFGPRELLGFDEKSAVDPAQPLAAEYDLGPARGRRPTRAMQAKACGVHLGGGPVADGGVSWAETAVKVQAAGDYVVRVDTPNSVELYVDGKSVLRVDRRRVLGARVVCQTLRLQPGTHRVVA